MSTEIAIRLGFFLGIFVLVAVCEIFAPRRALTTSKASRWFANLMIIGLNPLSVRLVFPVFPAAMALLATERPWGLLNNVELPYWIEVAMGVVALDLSIYLQHVLHHAIPALWRLHMVHHADLDYDHRKRDWIGACHFLQYCQAARRVSGCYQSASRRGNL